MRTKKITLALGALASIAAGAATAQTPLTYSNNGSNVTVHTSASCTSSEK